MSKYEPLTNFLGRRAGQTLRLSFAEIESLLGFALPPSKQHPAWWSNNPQNNVMTKAWLAAGYKTEQIDIAGEKVTFAPAATHARNIADESERPARHPAWGAWKGLASPDHAYDYTQPADPTWARVYDE
jgi:hypothetical protein